MPKMQLKRKYIFIGCIIQILGGLLCWKLFILKKSTSTRPQQQHQQHVRRIERKARPTQVEKHVVHPVAHQRKAVNYLPSLEKYSRLQKNWHTDMINITTYKDKQIQQVNYYGRSFPPLKVSDFVSELPFLDEDLSCLTWKQTMDCSTNKAASDSRECSAILDSSSSGYCEIYNRRTGTRMKAIELECNSLITTKLSCDYSKYFLNFKTNTLMALNAPNNFSIGHGVGIVMTSHADSIDNAFASILVLRQHECTLPIELWHLPGEFDLENPIITSLVKYYNVVLREANERVLSYYIKPYALLHSRFESILMIDSDNLLARDPTYLFQTKEFKQYGAIFWPSYWRPNNTVNHISKKNLIWQLTGVDFADQFEHDGGQLLVNKKVCQKALRVLDFFSSHDPLLISELEILNGDKDLYRLAWMRSRQKFYVIPKLPGSAGWVNPEDHGFCGVTMVHYDTNGEMLFFHRTIAKGIKGFIPVWTHIQEFSLKADYWEYKAERLEKENSYIGRRYCEGLYNYLNETTNYGKDVLFNVYPINRTKYRDLEISFLFHLKKGYLWRYGVDALKELENIDAARSAPTIVYDKIDQIWTKNNFKCISWRQTGGCHFNGAREHQKDKSCDEIISQGMSGFCEIQDSVTKKYTKLMLSHCDSVKDGSFTCNMAIDFANFANLSAQAARNGKKYVNKESASKNEVGIVMSVHAGILPSAYANIMILRYHRCNFPIELWYLPGELNLGCTPIIELVKYYNVILREVKDPNVKGYYIKPYALLHSRFESVLMLDADNVASRDPSYLFQTEEFKKYGAIFWPDYWRPATTTFNVHQRSLVWQLTGLPFVDEFEHESGQLLVNKTKSERGLRVLEFYITKKPLFLSEMNLLWGDKDIFRFAWRRANSSFFVIPQPPSSAGWYIPKERGFCGVTMVQHDPNGSILFFHRTVGKAIKGLSPVWTHIQVYSKDADPMQYVVSETKHGRKNSGQDNCYGSWDFQNRTTREGKRQFSLYNIKGSRFDGLESKYFNFLRKCMILLYGEDIFGMSKNPKLTDIAG